MTGIVYKLAPENVFHSWVEVLLEGTWYELEAFILDRAYLTKLQQINADCPDELLKEHHQEMSKVKAFACRHFGRHQMNKNVEKIRKRNPENKKHLPVYGVGPVYCACIIGATVAGILLSGLGVLPSVRIEALTLPLMIAGMLIAGLGFYVWFQAAFRIGKYIVENKLCVDGIFAVVRNPVYSGFMLMCTGALLMAKNLWLLLLPPIYWAAMTVLMKNTEETWLRELYGQEYADYCKRVNRCIPWFRNKRQSVRK